MDLTHGAVDPFRGHRKLWESTRDVGRFALACHWGADPDEQQKQIARAVEEGQLENEEYAVDFAIDVLDGDMAEMGCEYGATPEGIDAVYAALDELEGK